MSDLPLARRKFLLSTGSALLAGMASQSVTAQTASGPTVYIGTAEMSVDPNNTLYAVDAGTGEQEWAFTNPSDLITSSPTVMDGTVYVGSSDQTLYAVGAATGEQEWAFTEPSGAVSSSPTVVDGTVYVGSDDNTLYAVDAAEGTQEWAFTDPSDAIFSSPTVVDGTVYVGSGDERLYAVDVATGDQEWAFTEPSSAVTSSPTVWEGTVYVGSLDNTLYAVDVATGEREWAFAEPSGEIRSSPTVWEGTVYVGAYDNTLYAVDAAEGTQEWAFTEPSGRVDSSPTVWDGTVYVGSKDETLYAVDAATGEQEWAFTEPSGEVSSSPTVWDGTVYVGSNDEALYAVDADEGTQEWAFTESSDEIRSSPTVVEDPASGDSIGSRVRLGALGHHNALESGDSSGLLGPTEMAAVGGGGLVTLLGLYTLIRDSEDTDQQPDDESDDRRRQPAGPQYERPRDDADDATQVPTSIPGAPRLSLTYDEIKKGEAIGKGGNADVYYATATTDEGEYEFALKQPRMSGTLHTETVERMLEEAETWQRLDDHDHIVSVIDYGSEPLPWIAMEYMDSGHLRDQAGDLALNRGLWTAITIAEAVHHAHRQGVAHLDLKPENVLFRSVEGAWDVPKVADWGLSKHLLEHSKSVEGFSPQYAAPEQFDDSYGDTDDLTDVYQLGAVFYELFTGRPPFEGKPAMVMNKVLNEEPPPPSTVADVPAELDNVLQQALAKHKNDRYESVLYLRDELEDLFESL